MERKNICVNTTDIRKHLKRLHEHDANDWTDCPNDGELLYNLQEQLRPEREFLKSFWGCLDGEKNAHVLDKFFIPWDYRPALYDMPLDRQKYALNRSDGKYGIFHEREDYLEDLQLEICSLFHSWQFCTQGWTAY